MRALTVALALLVSNTQAQTVDLKKIHLVYMTHLDLGFTDTTRNVCDRYFDLYFPQSFKLSSDLRASCKDPSTCPVFRWTQFPWLIQEFLDGAAGCSHRKRTPDEISAMETAISNDDVLWHANPVNWLTEVADAELFSYGLQMRKRLNTRFNKTHGATAAKLSDTTGMSRSAIPTLVKSGVSNFHIGYNGVGGLPKVFTNGTVYSSGTSFCGRDSGCPNEAIFRWVEPNTGAELLTMIEGNYGNEVDVPLAGEGSEATRYLYAPPTPCLTTPSAIYRPPSCAPQRHLAWHSFSTFLWIIPECRVPKRCAHPTPNRRPSDAHPTHPSDIHRCPNSGQLSGRSIPTQRS